MADWSALCNAGDMDDSPERYVNASRFEGWGVEMRECQLHGEYTSPPVYCTLPRGIRHGLKLLSGVGGRIESGDVDPNSRHLKMHRVATVEG